MMGRPRRRRFGAASTAADVAGPDRGAGKESEGGRGNVFRSGDGSSTGGKNTGIVNRGNVGIGNLNFFPNRRRFSDGMA